MFRQNEIATYPHERHLFYPHSSPSLNDSMKKVWLILILTWMWGIKHTTATPVRWISVLIPAPLPLPLPHLPEVHSSQAGVPPPGQSQFLAPFFGRHGQVQQRLLLIDVNSLSSNKSSDDDLSFPADLEECESYLLELNLLLKSMEVLHRTYSAPAISGLQVSTCADTSANFTVVLYCRCVPHLLNVAFSYLIDLTCVFFLATGVCL